MFTAGTFRSAKTRDVWPIQTKAVRFCKCCRLSASPAIFAATMATGRRELPGRRERRPASRRTRACAASRNTPVAPMRKRSSEMGRRRRVRSPSRTEGQPQIDLAMRAMRSNSGDPSTLDGPASPDAKSNPWRRTRPWNDCGASHEPGAPAIDADQDDRTQPSGAILQEFRTPRNGRPRDRASGGTPAAGISPRPRLSHERYAAADARV